EQAEQHIGCDLAGEELPAAEAVDHVLSERPILKFVGDGNHGHNAQYDFEKAAKINQVKPHIRKVVERNAIDIQFRAKIFKCTGHPLQQFHTTGGEERKGNKVQTADNPERSVAGKFFQVDAEKMQHCELRITS